VAFDQEDISKPVRGQLAVFTNTKSSSFPEMKLQIIVTTIDIRPHGSGKLQTDAYITMIWLALEAEGGVNGIKECGPKAPDPKHEPPAEKLDLSIPGIPEKAEHFLCSGNLCHPCPQVNTHSSIRNLGEHSIIACNEVGLAIKVRIIIPKLEPSVNVLCRSFFYSRIQKLWSDKRNKFLEQTKRLLETLASLAFAANEIGHHPAGWENANLTSG
jgi:hypothetical protein